MSLQSMPWEQPFPWAQPIAPQPHDQDNAVRAILNSFDRYREKFLKIRPRTGGERIPFKLNDAQQLLHKRLEQEAQHYGRVRALIPKARRMGVSTYISSRYFFKTATRKGRRAHVVAHRSDSASTLHREVKLFYEGLPVPWRPHVSASNARELIFDVLQSVYKVSSAEGGDIGRSDDTHYLHLSEAGFFDNTADLSSGLLNTVLDQVETEIAMESTGNGANGMFFNMCEQAHHEKNAGLWRLHFLPWHVMPEYAEPVPASWTAPREFVDYGRLHGLSLDRVYWFWRQNYTMALMNGGQPDSIHRLTRQEFPITFMECFSTDSTMDFFPSSLVQGAMLSKAPPAAGSLKIIGIDPSGDGSDDCFICDREGSAIGRRIWGAIKDKDYNTQADWVVAAYRRFNMDVICVDATGTGKGLVDAIRLRMREKADRVVSINFGSGAHNSVQFGNRRSELHFKFSLWLQGAVSMPSDKELGEECAAYKWGQGGCRRDELARLFMTPKEKIRSEIKRSPDRLDCIITTFAVNDYALAGEPH
jgi:hypothetical protein